MNPSLALLVLTLLTHSHLLSGSPNLYQYSTNTLSPQDYLMGSNGAMGDPIFDRYRTIDLEVDVGVDSDCGRINIRSTMRAALKNILDTKYLGDMGRDIVAASPMLLTCYYSPTWCAILKHARLRANFLSQIRLDQCKAIDKYTDQRVSDYYEDRSKCIQKSIKYHNGDFEKAMESCKNYQAYSLSDWSGGNSNGFKRLIDSSAKWAGMDHSDAKRVVDLTKAFIGDTIIKRGEVQVDFGPRRVQLTPRTYLMETKKNIYKKLCKNLLPKITRAGGRKVNLYRLVSKKELQDIGESNQVQLDHQTIISLMHLPYKKRQLACRKLSDALAMGVFSEDMGQTLDFIYSKLSTNPHLPTKIKKDVELKRRAFKDHVELSLSLEKANTQPLNQVLFQINREGMKYQSKSTKAEIKVDTTTSKARHIDSLFFDCSDGIGCQY